MSSRSRFLNLFLAATAGLAGGLIPHFFAAGVVHAQTPPATEASKEVRAQRFSLVNDQGKIVGFLGIGQDGKAEIVLYDEGGRTIWSTRAVAIPVVK
jgi:hypothetical protein